MSYIYDFAIYLYEVLQRRSRTFYVIKYFAFKFN